MTPAVGCAAPMNAIPAADDFQISKFDVIAVHEINRVIGGVYDGEIVKTHVAAVDEIEGVRAAHFFFAGRIEHFVAVDCAGAADGDVFEIFADEEGAMPFAPAGFDHIRGRLGRGVFGEVGCADDGGSGFEVERDIAAEANRAGEITAGGDADLAA